METELTDIELLRRVSVKDSKALEALYDRYSTVLFTLIKKIVASEDKAEEILSDIFVIIWLKAGSLDLDSVVVFTWMITLARNKSFDVLKRDRGLIESEYNDDYENEFILPKVFSQAPSVELKNLLENAGLINSAFHKLTEAQQYVLNLAYLEGLTESEIAQKLKIPLLTVKSKIRVAVSSLKENIFREDNQ